MKQLFLAVISLLSAFLLQAQNVALLHTAFELDGMVKKDTVIIPLKLTPPLKIQDITLLSDTPFYVRLGNNQLDNKFRNAIRVFKTRGEQPSLSIATDLLLLNAAGTYEVTIAYTTDKPDMQTLTVSLIRPAATLDTLSTVHINIIGNEITRGCFNVEETGRKANINGLHLSTPFFAGINKDNLVTFPSKTYSIPAGSRFCTTYATNDKLLHSLPLGKTSGKMRVMTPEMAAPLIVPFEILHKRDKSWIIITVFLGLVLGAVVRHLLKGKKEWEALKIKGYELAQRIIDETRKVGDEAFRKEIANLLNELNPYLDSKGGLSYFTGLTDVPLAAKIETTTTAYNTKKEAFNTNLNTQEDRLKQLSPIFEDSTLSDTIKSLLATAKTTYNNAKLQLEKLNASGAKTSIEQAIKEVNKAIESFTRYHQSLAVLMLRDDFYPEAIPKEIKDSVKKYITTMQETLGKVKSNITDPKEITDTIGITDRIVMLKEEMMAYFNRNMAGIYDLKNAKRNTPEVMTFVNTFNEWSTMLKNISQNPQERPDAAEYWTNELISRVNKSWEPAEKSIETTMNREAFTAPPEVVNTVVLPERPVFTPADYFNTGGAGLARIYSGIRSAQKYNFLYALIQTIILAVLLGVIACNFYGAAFIGTLDELLVIFFFAFSIDVTLDNVMQLKSGKIGS